MVEVEQRFGKVELIFTEDMVRYSFLVQKSLTPLDLSTLEFTYRKPTTFTEEGFQKLFGVEDRRVLFEYHLDVSYGLEKALKDNDPTIFECDRTNKFETSVYRGVEFSEGYYDCLNNFWPEIMEAIRNSPNKIAKLKKLFPLMKMMQISHGCLGFYQYRDFARILQEECTDSELVAEFLEACGKENIFNYLLEHGDTEQMEYFLHHSQKMKIEMNFEGHFYRCPVTRSVFYGGFREAIILIKYGKIKQPLNDEDVIYHANELLDLNLAAMNFIQINRNSNFGYELGFGSMGRVKKWLFLLLIGVFCFRDIPEFLGAFPLGVEALRLMWRSLPESYLTLSEIQSAWRPDTWINWLTADQVYTLYKAEIMDGGNQVSDEEGPRSLKHLARCAIRGRLAANCALPDRIELLGLPQPIQAFIRLDN